MIITTYNEINKCLQYKIIKNNIVTYYLTKNNQINPLKLFELI